LTPINLSSSDQLEIEQSIGERAEDKLHRPEPFLTPVKHDILGLHTMGRSRSGGEVERTCGYLEERQQKAVEGAKIGNSSPQPSRHKLELECVAVVLSKLF
jgi:hypothetical protein